jgi:hypothetical protein
LHLQLCTTEPYHLKSQNLPPEVGWGPEEDGQVDLPKGGNSSAGSDAVKRSGPSPDLGPANPHEVQGFYLDDVEDAGSIHEYLGEFGVVDDWVDDERVPPRVQDVVRVVVSVEGDGAVGPI